ncbi:MAG TPA: GGDEF domain-containing protein [Bryobacteraceae bacterium]|nr:GGDEF domain-containing protein [Bryobacteraceae bacterium]
MPSWVLPLAVELVLTLVFAGVLLSLRRSLEKRTVVLWVFVWAAAGIVFTAQWFARLPLLYIPVQIAFAVALVFVAVRLESQREQLHALRDELERLRAETRQFLDADPLTGLLNRSALERWLEQEREFTGLIVVCDMDDFKQLNDRYGHLVGDEILRGVGKLVRGSIRERDMAFRWGGDEFVIFFRSLDPGVAEARMLTVEERLSNFQIRKYGRMAIRFSWGIARADDNVTVREGLAEADRQMYARKKEKQKTTAG